MMNIAVVFQSSYTFKCAVGHSPRFEVVDCTLPEYSKPAQCLCANERGKRCRVEKMMS